MNNPENVQSSVSPTGQLSLIVDLSKRLGPSKTGKTISVASTYGPYKVRHGEKEYIVNLNVNLKGS